MEFHYWLLPSFAALVFWGASSFAPKLAMLRLKPLEVLAYQAAGMILFALTLVLVRGVPQGDDPQAVLLAMGAGVAGMLGQICYIYALSRGKVSVVSVLCSLYPALVMLMAYFILGETIRVLQMAGCLLALASLAMMVDQGRKGATREMSASGWIVPGLAAVVLWSIWAFLPKLSTGTVAPQDILVYVVAGDTAVLLFVLARLRFRVTISSAGFFYCLIPSYFSTAGALAYYYAISIGPVSVIAVLTALYPMVSVFLAYAILSERISRKQAGAIICALAAVAMMAI